MVMHIISTVNESSGYIDSGKDKVVKIKNAPQLISQSLISSFFEAKVSVCGDYSALN